jgi:hypothetical protein
MDPKINREELAEIVEETARLHDEDEQQIPPSEAKQILRELDLPADRLDEARRAVADRRLKRDAKLRMLVIGGIVLLVLTVGATALTMSQNEKAHELANMTVPQSGLTLHGYPLPGPVPRAPSPELSFDVVLANPPRARVALSCDWTGPDGNVHFQNRWETQSIDRDVWPTHCRRAFTTNEPAGPWSVTMKEESRVLASGGFVLE